MAKLSDVMGLLAEHQWIFDFKLTHFFTDKVWEAIPTEWQTVMHIMTSDDLEGIPFGLLKDEWPESLTTFITDCLRYSMPRQRSTSEFKPVSKTDIDAYIARGMSEKKLHEVCHMTVLVDHVTRSSGSNCVVDVGSGLGYLGQVLHTRYGHNVLGLEGKGSHTSGAERRMVSQCVCCSLQNKTCELYDTEESRASFLTLLSDWFSRLPADGSSCCHMMGSTRGNGETKQINNLDNSCAPELTKQISIGDNINTYEFDTKCRLSSNDKGPTCPLYQTQCCDRVGGTSSDINPLPYQRIDPNSRKMDHHLHVSVSDSKCRLPDFITCQPHVSCGTKAEYEVTNVDLNSASCDACIKNVSESIQYIKTPHQKIKPRVYVSGECDIDSNSSCSQAQPSVHTADKFYTNLPPRKEHINSYSDDELYMSVTRKYVTAKVYDSDNVFTSNKTSAPDSKLYDTNAVYANKSNSTPNDRRYDLDKQFTNQKLCDVEHTKYTCDKSYTTIPNKDTDGVTTLYKGDTYCTTTLKKEPSPTLYPSDSSTFRTQLKDSLMSGCTDRRASEPQPRVCMVGLHCCGDLTPTMLRYFTEMQSIRSLCCISCCYHRMSFNDGSKQFCEFPMSSQGQLTYSQVRAQYPQFQLRGYSMRLAAQETRTRWQAQTVDDHNFHLRNVAYRGLLELCLQRGDFVLVKTSRKLAHRQDHETFDRYIDAIVKHLQMPVGDNAQDHVDKFKKTMVSLHDDYRDYFLYIEPITALQVLLQPVLETLIHTDRQTWLQERGLHARLVPIFDDFISPRNVALVAIK